MLTGNYKKFCKNYEMCEGYEKAKNRFKVVRDDGTWYWGHRK